MDADRLCRAIETTIKAHPTFFTRIGVTDDGEPFQAIDLENEEFSLSVEQVTDLEAEKKKFIEPFKLYGGRLFHTKALSLSRTGLGYRRLFNSHSFRAFGGHRHNMPPFPLQGQPPAFYVSPDKTRQFLTRHSLLFTW
ncbi:MAG: hypothetical protein IJK78_11345 [Bacteroidales bacterium]|nr:hypothetical protein [Bacteroidales bacterium]